MNSLPSIRELHRRLRYDPDDGVLYWRARVPGDRDYRRWNVRYAGTVAGRTSVGGYIIIKIEYVAYHAHRLIFAMNHGRHPATHIDHIDGDPGNNKISNLREVTHTENMRNAKLRKDNQSGVCGVSWYHKRWVARINTAKGTKNIGSFSRIEDAVMARRDAEIEHGYSPRHGKRA